MRPLNLGANTTLPSHHKWEPEVVEHIAPSGATVLWVITFGRCELRQPYITRRERDVSEVASAVTSEHPLIRCFQAAHVANLLEQWRETDAAEETELRVECSQRGTTSHERVGRRRS